MPELPAAGQQPENRLARWRSAWSASVRRGYAAAALGLLSLGVMLQPELIFLGIVSALLYKVWMIVVSVALLRGPLAVRCAAPYAATLL